MRDIKGVLHPMRKRWNTQPAWPPRYCSLLLHLFVIPMAVHEQAQITDGDWRASIRKLC